MMLPAMTLEWRERERESEAIWWVLAKQSDKVHEWGKKRNEL